MTNEKTLLYKQAHVELYEIIKHLTKNEKDKIPKSFINNLALNVDNNYIFKYEPSKSIIEQDLKTETKALLVQMYIRYLAPKEDQEFWKKYNRACLNKVEQEKSKNYTYEDLFINNKELSKKIVEPSTNDNDLIKYKQSLFKRLWNKLLSIFKK